MPLANVINSLQIEDAFFFLLTLTVGGQTLRAVNNLEDVTSRGQVYTAFPFELTLPIDDGEKPQALTFTIMNVGEQLIKLIRGFDPDEMPQVKFELVLSSAPDVVEKTIDFLTVTSVDYDVEKVTFTLASSFIFARKTCTATYSQAEFPALFFAV